MMQIIPVIDIKNGCAVLASQGNRKSYRPLATPLCSSSLVEDVVNAYLNLFAFSKIYIADLDALMGTGNNYSLINSLFSRFPEIHFMVDTGSVEPGFTPPQPRQFTTIIGTESINTDALKDLKHKTANFILSLDFSSHHRLMGESVIYDSPYLWPNSLIIMTLGMVGGNNGPDFLTLQHYCNAYPKYDFIAAGGIRNAHDLIQLRKIGIQQTLVASCLHSGKLTRFDIQALST